MERKQDSLDMRTLCSKHMNQYVSAEMEDGTRFDGIIADLDDRYVYLDVPEEPHEPEFRTADERQFWGPYPRPYGPFYGGFYGYPGPGFPGYYGPARFRRLVLPLAALTALTLLPWY